MTSKTIYIKLSDTNRPHIESRAEYCKSLFKEQYDLCFQTIESVLIANDLIGRDERTECNNNIIVFAGERGSGKTSCMLSVAKMLTEDGTWDCISGYTHLCNQKFIQMKMLEPSFFDKEHNVVTLFVSRLYRQFQELDKTGRDDTKRHRLLEQFCKVQQSIKCIFGDFEPKDGLEYLVELSFAIDLKEELCNLVNLYLDYSEKKEHKLLVLIDDVDINPKMAQEMSEYVRKYLILPNIVVLMSLKIEQLSGILQRKYAEEYNNQITPEVTEEIKDRVEKYITKLFPQTQRIGMPTADVLHDCKIVIEDGPSWGYRLPDDLYIRQIIPELIFQKTRYLFYNTNKHTSYIVPRNLRDIRQLLHLLIQMPDYSDDLEQNIHIENKTRFKNYLFEDWVDTNLDETQKKFVEKLLAVEKVEDLNYTTVSVLGKLSSRLQGSIYGEEGVGKILDPLNNTINISLGDVISLIRVLERIDPAEPLRRFLFFVRSFYSIKLYEAYDTITSSSELSSREKKVTTINRGLHRLVKNDYEAIVAGCMCNVEVFDILPRITSTLQISTRAISRESLVELANKCVEVWNTPERGQYVRIMELIMLSIYYDDSNSAESQNNFRKFQNISYKVIAPEAMDLYFDIGALMYNITRFSESILRFRSLPELTDFFNKYKGAEMKSYLLNDFRLMTEKYRHKPNKTAREKWLSFCCFRNIELLEDFLDYIKGHIRFYNNKDGMFIEAKPTDVVENFLDEASRYVINSYDRFDDTGDGFEDKAYEIHFKYFGILAQLLRNENNKKAFSKVFDSVEKRSNPFDEIVGL